MFAPLRLPFISETVLMQAVGPHNDKPIDAGQRRMEIRVYD